MVPGKCPMCGSPTFDSCGDCGWRPFPDSKVDCLGKPYHTALNEYPPGTYTCEVCDAVLVGELKELKENPSCGQKAEKGQE